MPWCPTASYVFPVGWTSKNDPLFLHFVINPLYSYLTKPLELSELQRVVESVGVPLLDMNEKKKKKKKKKKAVNGDSHTDGPEGADTAGDVKLTLQNDTDLDLDVPHTTTNCAYADVVQLSVPGQRSPSQVSMESLEETML